MPKYLIKFIKEEHLNYLLDIGLYMNAAGYYIPNKELQEKQADAHEGLCFPYGCAYKNRNRPIWCCTAIKDNEIQNNTIVLDKKLFKDFFGRNLGVGRLVLFEYKTFIEYFLKNKDKYRSAYGCINYYPYQYFRNCFASTDWSDCLFRKDSEYAHQKEFRIAIDRECKRIFENEEIDGVNCEVLKSYEAYEFPFPNLRAISKVYNADELPFDGKSYFLTL
jgi:hypothetical protein